MNTVDARENNMRNNYYFLIATYFMVRRTSIYQEFLLDAISFNIFFTGMSNDFIFHLER